MLLCCSRSVFRPSHTFTNTLLLTNASPKALAKRTRQSAQVSDLRSACISFDHLRALTCDDFVRAQIHTQLDACFSPFGRSRQVDTSYHKSTVYAGNLRRCASCLNLRANLRIRLSTHRKSVRKFWFCKLASTCGSPFGQGLITVSVAVQS